MSKKQKQLINLVMTAILSALAMVLNRFLSFNVWNLSVGFSFLPTMICGMLCGPLWGGLCGALADFMGALLFPFGTFHPGFTAVAFISGMLFGIIGSLDKVIGRSYIFYLTSAFIIFLNETVCTLLVNSFWISRLSGTVYSAVLISRVPKAVAMFFIQLAFVVLIRQYILPMLRKVIGRN